jgi:hypothetical protein
VTDKAINIAINDSLGWGPYDRYETREGVTWGSDMGRVGRTRIPDYVHDLNAMHEAERKLSPKQWDEYVRNLNNGFVTFDIEDVGRLLFSAARQRAEAFLRTIGKWEDEQ